MADSFLFNIAESVLGQIASLAAAEISLAWGVKDDLRKLQSTLSNVKAVILDAEEQQMTSHEVATWLGQLKNVLFDAENVFDAFAYEALRKQVVNTRGGITKKVNLSSLRLLSITSLPQMESLPEWILKECASSLDFLEIVDCPNLTTLPEWLHNLIFLHKLVISECPKLMSMPKGMQGLTSLKELVIHDCPELSRRCRQGVGEDWPKIKHIPKIDLHENENKDFQQVAASFNI